MKQKKEGNNLTDEILATVGAFAIFAVLLFGLNFIWLWLWNGIISPKFGLPTFTYWEMYGMIIFIRGVLPTTRYTVNKD